MKRRAALLILATLAAFGATKPDIEYGKANGISLRLDASTPEGAGPFPVAILVHGGGWASGDKATDITPLFKPLTDAHFTWFSINYRMAPANRWPACFDDVQTAIRWVKAHAADYKGDPHHIALIGYSAGGQLAFLAAVEAKDDTRVQAVVGLAPPTDLELDLPTRGGLSPSLQALLDRPHELTPDARAILRDISAINHIHPNLPPFLIIHGNADKSVPYQGSLNFQKKLEAQGTPCELITLPGAPHNISRWSAIDPAFPQKMVHWLEAAMPAVTPPAPPHALALPSGR